MFSQRVKIYTSWRNTVASLQAKRAAATKFQQQGKIDKQRLTEEDIERVNTFILNDITESFLGSG